MSEGIMIQAKKVGREHEIKLVSNLCDASGDFITDEAEILKRLKTRQGWPFAGILSEKTIEKIMAPSFDQPISDSRFLPAWRKFNRPKPRPLPGREL